MEHLAFSYICCFIIIACERILVTYAKNKCALCLESMCSENYDTSTLAKNVTRNSSKIKNKKENVAITVITIIVVV